MESPDVRYAEAGDGVHIAYQIVGEGPVDVLFVPELLVLAPASQTGNGGGVPLP